MSVLCKYIAVIFIVLYVPVTHALRWDYCSEQKGKLSYGYEDEVCSVKEVLGYVTTASMNPERGDGFFRPVMKVAQGTRWRGIDQCSRMGSPTELDYLYIAGNKRIRQGEWVFRYVFPAGVCLRMEPVRTVPYSKSDIGTHCFSKLHSTEQQDFLSGRGKFGADYPGQMALCAYTTSWLTDNRWCDDMRNSHKIKCIKIPQAPVPPPFCDIIPSNSTVRAAYIKPNDAMGINTYFSPAVKIIASVSKLRCGDGSLIEVGNTCYDGRPGVVERFSYSDSVSFSVDKNERNNNGLMTARLNDTNYSVSADIYRDEVCFKGSYDDRGARQSLACFPRTPPRVRDLEVIGSIDANESSLDSLYLRAYFYGAPAQKPYAQVPVASVDKRIDILNNSRSSMDLVQSEYYKLMLTAMRTNFAPRGDEADDILPKRVCLRSDGKYAAISADIRCDEGVGISVVERYLCNGKYSVSRPSECDGHSVATKMKQCSGNVYVDLDKSCNVTGTVLYDDDPEGDKVCLQGVEQGSNRFFLIKKNSNGKQYKHYFKSSQSMLIPIKRTGNGVVDDNSRAAVPMSALDQDALDNLIYNSGYYAIERPGNLAGEYRYGFIEDEDSSGRKTHYIDERTGNPFFVSKEENELVLPVDPVSRGGMCVKIPRNSLTIHRPFSIEYNAPGIYSSAVFEKSIVRPVNDNTPIKSGVSANSQLADVISKLNKSNYFDQKSMIRTELMHLLNIEALEYYDLKDYVEYVAKMPGGGKYDMHAEGQRSWYGDYSGASLRAHTESAIKRGAIRGSVEAGGNVIRDHAGLTYSAYFVDERMNTSGCSVLDFELWGGGARGFGSHVILVNRKYWVPNFFSNNEHHICYYGHQGESGAYVKGQMRLRRGSRLLVVVAKEDTKDARSPGTSLWIAERGEPFKLVALAESGNATSPYNGGNGDLSAYVAPHDNPRFRDVLDLKTFGTANYYDDKGGVYEKPETIYIDKARARILEYRPVEGSTHCGMNYLKTGEVSNFASLTGPIIEVDGIGNESTIAIGSDLRRYGDRSTDLNYVGTWAFFRQAEHAGKSSCQDMASYYKLFEPKNSHRSVCLRYVTQVHCGEQFNIGSKPNSETWARAQAEKCRGIGGSYKTNDGGWVNHRFSDSAEGNFGYAKLTCR